MSYAFVIRRIAVKSAIIYVAAKATARFIVEISSD
jgi:hypothetical protein